MSSINETQKVEIINEIIFCMLLLIYSIWRHNNTLVAKKNLHKSRMRTVGKFLIFSSIAYSFLFNVIFWAINEKAQLEKHRFELIGFSKDAFIVDFRNLKIDILVLLEVLHLFAKVFRISSIFMLIGMWGPCLYSFTNTEGINNSYYSYKQSDTKIYISEDIFKTSIATFSKIYSIFRIPVLCFIHYKLKKYWFSNMIFFESLFMSAEIYLCIALFLILQTKHNFISGQKGMDTIALLNFSLGIFGFLCYSVNSIAFPFSVNNLMYQVVQSLVFALKFIIDVLVVNVYCPLNFQIYDEIENKTEQAIEVRYESRDIIARN